MPIQVSSNLIPRGGYFLVEDTYLRGGFRVAASVSAMSAIPKTSRKEGMRVLVVESNQEFKLEADLITWTPVVVRYADLHDKPTTADALGLTDVVKTSDVGVSVAPLNAQQIIDPKYLPSYVSDVLDYATFSAFPAAGVASAIYVDVSTNKCYRWSGASYIEVNSVLGTADIALKLASIRSLSATGDATWTVQFDGSANASSALTLSNTGVQSGTYGSASSIYPFTFDAKGRLVSVGEPIAIAPLFENIVGFPTTVAGLGLTDAVTSAMSGVANGWLPLNAQAQIDSKYLPLASCNDVLEYTSTANFPATGAAGIVYIDGTANKLYRWAGSAYVEMAVDSREMILACSDESTAITAGVKITFRAPFALKLLRIPRASLSTASTSGLVTVDVKVGGTSILGGNKLSIDAAEKTSVTAATATTLATTDIADDAEITVEVTAAGTGAKGLKVCLLYARA